MSHFRGVLRDSNIQFGAEKNIGVTVDGYFGDYAPSICATFSLMVLANKQHEPFNVYLQMNKYTKNKGKKKQLSGTIKNPLQS